jgi:hypothetical protein
LSTKLIIDGAVSLFVGFLVFGMVQTFVDAQNQTGWNAMAVSIASIAPTILLLLVAIGLFMLMTKVSGV